MKPIKTIDPWNLTFPLNTTDCQAIATHLATEFNGSLSNSRATNLLRVLDGASETGRFVSLAQMNEEFELGVPPASLHRTLNEYWEPIVIKHKASYQLDRKELMALLREGAKRSPRPVAKKQRNGVGIKTPTDLTPQVIEYVQNGEFEHSNGMLALIQVYSTNPHLEFEINSRRRQVQENLEGWRETDTLMQFVDNFLAMWLLFAFLTKGNPNPGLLEELLEAFPPVEFDRAQQLNYEKFWNWYCNIFPR